jgi:uncharacterized membrane protein
MVWVGVGLGAVSLGAAGLAVLMKPRRRGRPEPGEKLVTVRRPRRRGGRITVTVEKALDVRAPLRQVFGVGARVENLPQVVPHLREVREVAIDRHHWTMGEPPEHPIEWDTRITRFGGNQIVAWESVPGSVIKHDGSLRFRPNADGGTRVGLHLSYVLPPGPFGERAAALTRADGIDDALRRWKGSLE